MLLIVKSLTYSKKIPSKGLKDTKFQTKEIRNYKKYCQSEFTGLPDVYMLHLEPVLSYCVGPHVVNHYILTRNYMVLLRFREVGKISLLCEIFNCYC